VFGQGARERIIQQYGIRNAFEMPIEPELSRSGDGGVPFVLQHPKSDTARLFGELGQAVHREVTALEQGLQLRPRVVFTPGTGIEVALDEQHRGAIHPATLRRRCRCAHCVEEFSGRPILKPEDVPDNVYPVRLQPMGNYAMAIQWSDGHSSSIYPYEMLLELAGVVMPT